MHTQVIFIFALLMVPTCGKGSMLAEVRQGAEHRPQVQGLADYLGQYSREFGPESLNEDFVGWIGLPAYPASSLVSERASESEREREKERERAREREGEGERERERERASARERERGGSFGALFAGQKKGERERERE